MNNSTIAIIVFIVLLILVGGGIGIYLFINKSTTQPTSETELVPVPIPTPVVVETPPVVQEETTKPTVVQEESVTVTTTQPPTTTTTPTTTTSKPPPDCGIVIGSLPRLSQDSLVTTLLTGYYKWDNAPFGVIRFKNFAAASHKIDVIVRVIGTNSITTIKKCSTITRDSNKLTIKNAYSGKDYIFSLDGVKLKVEDGSGIKDVTKVSLGDYNKMKPTCSDATNVRQPNNNLLGNLLGNKYAWKSTIPFDFIKFTRVPNSTDTVFTTIYTISPDKSKSLSMTCNKLDLSDPTKLTIKNALGGQDVTFTKDNVIYGGATYKYQKSRIVEDRDLV